jgi:hypothetical protein
VFYFVALLQIQQNYFAVSVVFAGAWLRYYERNQT